jgi:hypothetical protein
MRNFIPHHKFHPDKILKQKLLGGRSLGLNKARSVYPVTSLATLAMTQSRDVTSLYLIRNPEFHLLCQCTFIIQ